MGVSAAPAHGEMSFRAIEVAALDTSFAERPALTWIVQSASPPTCHCRRRSLANSGRADGKNSVNTSFFSEMLQSIADRGRALIQRREPSRERSAGLLELCEALLSGRGEASGVALASDILARYEDLTIGPRIAFFEALATTFGSDRARIEKAIKAWQAAPSDETAAELHHVSEPRRLELFRRLNLAPGGTAALVRMREQLIDAMDHRDDLSDIDSDFVHLFSSWF